MERSSSYCTKTLAPSQLLLVTTQSLSGNSAMASHPILSSEKIVGKTMVASGGVWSLTGRPITADALVIRADCNDTHH